MGTIPKRLLACLLAAVLVLPVRADELSLRCGLTAHTHDASCYAQEQVLSCGKSETTLEPHQHTAGCYATRVVLNCPMDHQHSLGCYTSMSVLVCGLEEGDPQYHQHTEDCYTTNSVLTCTLPEHEHTEACYVDKTADLESPSDWAASVEAVELTGDPAADLIAIAESQLGNKESELNLDLATGNGYSRYGAWAGRPYDDWCAAFVCFCLSYAGIDYPHNLWCTAWVELLKEAGLFSETVTPLPGDLVFFSEDEDDISDHVGILTELDDNCITLIEGNSRSDDIDQVRYVTRSRTDSRIVGYGLIALREADEAETDELETADEPVEASPPAWVTAVLSQLGTTCPLGSGPYGSWTEPDFSLRLLQYFAQIPACSCRPGRPRAGDVVWFDRQRVGLVLYAGEDVLITVRVIGQTVTLSAHTGPILGYATPYRATRS